MSYGLKQVEAIVDRLSLSERLELLQYLAPRISVKPAEALNAGQPSATAAWERMKAIGLEIAREAGTGQTASLALSEIRR
jgi:hypothetical protein